MNTVIVVDDIFDEKYLTELDDLCKGELLQLDSETGNHVGKYTGYEWQMVKNKIRTDHRRIRLLKTISHFIGYDVPTDNLEPMQLFAKKFTQSSFINIHKEDPKVYGDWVWMLYLTDEVDGALCTGDITILPKRNRLVVMRTGFDHWVDSCSGDRINISGWPFATNEVRKKWKDTDSTKIV